MFSEDNPNLFFRWIILVTLHNKLPSSRDAYVYWDWHGVSKCVCVSPFPAGIAAGIPY